MTTVTLRSTAVASTGTPKLPVTLMVFAPLAATGLPALPGPLHWAAGPESEDGLPDRVSQIRVGTSGLKSPEVTTTLFVPEEGAKLASPE